MERDKGMRIDAIMHAPFETIGILEPWAQERGMDLRIHEPYLTGELPVADDLQCLVSMGGPQSACDLSQFSYLEKEVQLMKDLIKRDIPIVGVCLGAQLLSAAFGAKPAKSPEKEVGIFPISLTKKALKDPLFKGFPAVFSVLHWHHDMVGLPKEAEVLASSQGCPYQIIRFSPKHLGFQCHLEMNQRRVQELLRNCSEDLKPSLFTQSAEKILHYDYQWMNQALERILDRFLLNNKSVKDKTKLAR